MAQAFDARRMAEAVAEVRYRMEQAAKAAGRNPADILLCAVCKTRTPDTIRDSAALPVDLFGENHMQELVVNHDAGAYLEKPVHFIGHLQTNKVKKVVGKADIIQSVDSLRLLEAIDKEAGKQGLRQEILLELNIGEEASKSGFGADDILPLVDRISEFPNICIKGLMAIPPIQQNSGENLKFFQKMFQLSVDIRTKKYDNVMVDCLSMGMSGDFADAIAAGSTMIRVGTAIFGARNYAKDSSN